jgi:hypothetical protein
MARGDGDPGATSVGGFVVRLKVCAACGSKEDLQHHRLFTRRRRGKFADKWITLCYPCHAKLHERELAP